MKSINLTSGVIIAEEVETAFTFFKRLRGLMFKRSIKHNYALWIKPCNSIHMFFMNFPLDVIFLDENLTIVHYIEGINPGQVSPIIKEAVSVLELPKGTIKKHNIVIGDRLLIE